MGLCMCLCMSSNSLTHSEFCSKGVDNTTLLQTLCLISSQPIPFTIPRPNQHFPVLQIFQEPTRRSYNQAGGRTVTPFMSFDGFVFTSYFDRSLPTMLRTIPFLFLHSVFSLGLFLSHFIALLYNKRVEYTSRP